MKNVNIPEGYNQVMPYLIVPKAADVLKFAQEVFEAKEVLKLLNDDGSIMHAEVAIGKSVIMFANSTAEYPPQTAGLFIYVDDADAIYKKALSAGAKGIMEPSDKEYGRACGVLDSNGNTWWITTAPTE